MADNPKGELTFEARGRSYTLVYSFDALCQVEDQLDAPLKAVARKLAAGRLSHLRVFLWAGLRARHPEIDLQTAGDMIMEVDQAVLADVIARALTEAFPKQMEAAKGAPGPRPGRPATDD